MVKILLVLVVLIYSSVYVYGENKSGVDMAIFSIGTWGSINNTTGSNNTKDSYFTSFKSDLYYHVFGLKGYVGFPIIFTWEDYNASGNGKDTIDVKWALYPADLSMYFGKSLAIFEPRIGIEFPLGYPTGNIAWIGSNNINLIIGSGFSMGNYFNHKLNIGGEFMGRIFLTGNVSEGDRIEKGSFKCYLALKGSYKVSERLNIGIELFPYYSHFKNTSWTKDSSIYINGHYFKTIGIIPILFFSYKLQPKIEISLKGSYGWERGEDSNKRTNSNVIYTNLGLNFYFW